MYKYIIYFVLITPLLGTALLECGALGSEPWVEGYFNYSSIAYFIYLMIILAVFYINKKHHIVWLPIRFRQYELNDFVRIGIIILAINIVLCLLLLIFTDAADVLLNKTGKGTFRANLKNAGVLAYMIRDSITPVLIAFLTIVYSKTDKKLIPNLLYVLNLICASVISLFFGYKSGIIFILLPGLILFFWKISFKKIVLVAMASFILLLVLSLYFDGQERKSSEPFKINLLDPTINNPTNKVLYRLTVVQGNTSWKIWDKFRKHEELPEYLPTLSAVVGDRFLRKYYNINRDDYDNFIRFHYSELLTKCTGRSTDEIKNGHTTIGQVFSEGIIAGGIPGLLIFSVIAGLVISFCYLTIENSLNNNDYLISAIGANYFTSNIVSWLNGGGIVTLFHISTIAGILFNTILIICIVYFYRLIPIFRSMVLKHRRSDY